MNEQWTGWLERHVCATNKIDNWNTFQFSFSSFAVLCHSTKGWIKLCAGRACARRSARRVDSIMRAAIQTRKQNVPTAIHWDRSSSPAAVVVPDNHLLANAVASSQTCVKIQFPSTRDMHIVHTALFDWVQCLSATRNEVGKNVWFPVSTSLVTATGSRVRPSWCTVQLYSNCTRSNRVEVFDFWFNISARKPWDKRWMQKKKMVPSARLSV